MTTSEYVHIAFSVNKRFLYAVSVTITSLLTTNARLPFWIHILHEELDDTDEENLYRFEWMFPACRVQFHKLNGKDFDGMPLTIPGITRETFFRYSLSTLLPEADRVLYLDADIAITGDITPLLLTNIDDAYIAGVDDLWIRNMNYRKEIGLNPEDSYVNAGVLLFNLKKIREDGKHEEFFSLTREKGAELKYQDQDALNLVCREGIHLVNSKWNFCHENVKKEASKRKLARIIHFTGQKPWNEKCPNRLRGKWKQAEAEYLNLLRKKIKIGLLIDEFFGGAGTAYGGYGFLARHVISKYLPNDYIQVDVLLGKGSKQLSATCDHVDNVDVYRLPKCRHIARHWMKKKNYDVFLSIEMTNTFPLRMEADNTKKLVFWVQDSRPKSDWEEIETVKLFPETSYWDQSTYDMVNHMATQGRIDFVTQARFLTEKCRELYRLPSHLPIPFLPNPVEIDDNFDVDSYPKKDLIIFLGRIESVKRGWLFCEIAKLLPQYEFCVLGTSFRESSKNEKIMAPYYELPNLHFAGHVEGEKKAEFLKTAKILVNTSVHEALPVSFLEALSYGTLLVSNQNPEQLTERFGQCVGAVLGDGFEYVPKYADAIQNILSDEENRRHLAREAVDYIKTTHNIPAFVQAMRHTLRKNILH